MEKILSLMVLLGMTTFHVGCDQAPDKNADLNTLATRLASHVITPAAHRVALGTSGTISAGKDSIVSY